MAIGTPTVCGANRVSIALNNTTGSFSPTANVPAGAKAVLLIACLTKHALVGVVDSKGNTWTIDKPYSGTTSFIFAVSCDVATTVTTTDTITITQSSTNAANFDYLLYSVSGLQSGGFDQSATSEGVSTAAYTVGPTGVLSQADEIAFGVWGANVGETTQTAGGGWSLAGGGGAGLSRMQTVSAVYQIVSAVTALTATETANSASWSGILATYKGAPPPSSGPPNAHDSAQTAHDKLVALGYPESEATRLKNQWTHES